MRIACVQMNVVFGDPARNIKWIVDHLHTLSIEGVDLVVFPEAAVTGYCVDSAAEARRIAVPRNVLAPIETACQRLNLLAIVGFAESDGENVFNSAALFEPGVDTRVYRKTHLPELGLDRFVRPGQAMEVFETRLGKIGLLICFDLRFPEAARELVLQGAEILVLPTNWPEGAEVSANEITVARAAESRVFVATCNRVGTENGFTFIGLSKIVSPTGKILAGAGKGGEIIVAEFDIAEARQKKNIVIPGKYETDVIGSRRPELYGSLGIFTEAR